MRDLQSATSRLKADKHQGLEEEHEALRKNYQTLAEAHSKELAQSEELKAELLSLARAQDDLCRQVEEQQQSARTSSRDLHCELDRVRDLISRLSQNTVKVGRNRSLTALLSSCSPSSWKSLVETWSMLHSYFT